MTSLEFAQQARDILERCGWEHAQSRTGADVVEVANLLRDLQLLRAEVAALREQSAENLAKARQWRSEWEKHHATIGGLKAELAALREQLAIERAARAFEE